MSKLLKMLLPVHSTAQGRATVRTAAWARECRKIAASVVGQGLPYEIIEARLRLFTATTLLPQRRHNIDDIESFVRANISEVDAAWRPTIRAFMEAVDANPASAVAKELGFDVPAKPQGLASADVIDRPVPGKQAKYIALKENVDFVSV